VSGQNMKHVVIIVIFSIYSSDQVDRTQSCVSAST